MRLQVKEQLSWAVTLREESQVKQARHSDLCLSYTRWLRSALRKGWMMSPEFCLGRPSSWLLCCLQKEERNGSLHRAVPEAEGMGVGPEGRKERWRELDTWEI